MLNASLREAGAPIKKIENQSSRIYSTVMKMREDSFSYANQLGTGRVPARYT